MGSALGELAAAGCGRALLASNAIHLAFDQIDPPSPLPLIHIVDGTRDAVAAAGHRRVGLIGTQFVMAASMYPDRFAPAGLEIIVPTELEQEMVHRIYVGELVVGEFREDSRTRLVDLVATMRDRDAIDALVLGGTELPLTLTEPAYAGVPIIDASRIHVDAAIDWLLGGP